MKNDRIKIEFLTLTVSSSGLITIVIARVRLCVISFRNCYSFRQNCSAHCLDDYIRLPFL